MYEYKLPDVDQSVWVMVSSHPLRYDPREGNRDPINIELHIGDIPCHDNRDPEKKMFADITIMPGESVIFEINPRKNGRMISAEAVGAPDAEYSIGHSLFKLSI